MMITKWRRQIKFLSDSELSSATWEDAIIKEYDDDSKEYRIDSLWYQIQRLRSLVGNNHRFKLLFKVAKFILIPPHSNAAIERLFSLVNKNKFTGSDRNRQDIKGLITSILAVKIE